MKVLVAVTKGVFLGISERIRKISLHSQKSKGFFFIEKIEFSSFLLCNILLV